ncbi:MAG: M1 family aminopeptidase, partial [Planctomycetota bacterium]
MPIDDLGCRRSHVFTAGDFTIPGAESHYPPDLELEPKHLDITLAVDIDRRAAAGAVVTTVAANRAGARALELSACDLEDVEVTDEDGHGLSSRYDGREVSVLWDEPFDRGESRRLRISYRVEDPVSGLHFASPDEQYPDRARWVATDHETERARYWLPCLDYPAVRTTLTFHLTAPDDLTILANGVLESEEPNGDGTKTAHWRLDYPCPSYLICLAIGEFVRADDRPVGDREIAYFGARGRATEEDLGKSFGRTPEIMEWLEKRVGNPFPFPKYFQFALPGFGGAMENISLVSWDDFAVCDETLRKDIGELVDLVNVHEMAHSYFGDAVVIRDFAHAWLKESWATYIEACWREDKQGEDHFRCSLLWKARSYFEESDEQYSRPIVTRVFNSSWDMYDRHLYPGGACRIHMLRKMLGDDVFWAAVKDYLAAYSKRTVETEDFRRKLEEHSGRSLVKFFDQWIHGKGYPKLKVEFRHDADKGEGALTVTQTQVPEESGKKKEEEDPATPFAFDLTVAWETQDGEFQRRTFEVSKRKHTFVAAMEKSPRQIRVDPDGDVLHRLDFNPGDDMLRHALRNAPDVVGRILAAEELAKTGKKKNLEAVGEAYAEEPFWGARQMMAEAVAKSKSPLAIELLPRFLESEEDPRVRFTIADKAGGLRDPRIADALTRLLDGDPTYRVAATALASLGKQRGEAHLDRLREAASDEGYQNIVRRGALVGLGQTRTESAHELLMGRTGYGRETDDAAPAAAAALAEVSKHMERRHRDRAVEALADLCRDPRERVRRAAASALGNLKAAEGLPAVEAVIRT